MMMLSASRLDRFIYRQMPYLPMEEETGWEPRGGLEVLGKKKVSCSCWNPFHGQVAQDGDFRGIIQGGVWGRGDTGGAVDHPLPFAYALSLPLQCGVRL